MSNVNTRPISDFNDSLSEVAKAAHEINQPIILTENNSEDMVVMSYQTYQKFLLELEIDIKIAEAEIEEEYDDRLYTPEEVYNAMLEAINVKNNI